MRYILVILAVISLHSSAESINDCASLKGDAHYKCLAMATLSANQCDRILNYSTKVNCILSVTKESRRVRNSQRSS